MSDFLTAAWELRAPLGALVALAGLAVALDKLGAFYGGRR